jgi:hypothetical protein
MQRYTRIAAPPNPKELKDLQDWFRRVERAITELQNLHEQTTTTADALALEVAELEDDITSDAIPAWAVITASGDQSGIDESATPDLVTAFDTVYDGSAGHGVTVSGGIITLPANTEGYQWEVRGELWIVHSAAGQAAFRFYELPASTNTAIGLTGLMNSATYTGDGSHGGAGDALAWVAGATTVALRCTVATGATTLTIDSDWSRIICREVKL